MGLKLDGSNSRINADVTAPTFKTAEGTCTLNWRDPSQDAVAFCDGFNNQEITINCTWVSSNNTISGSYTFSGLESSEQTVDGMRLSLSYDSTSKNVSVRFYKEIGRDYTMACAIEVTYTTGIETGKHIEIHGNTRIEGDLQLTGGFNIKTLSTTASIENLKGAVHITDIPDVSGTQIDFPVLIKNVGQRNLVAINNLKLTPWIFNIPKNGYVFYTGKTTFPEKYIYFVDILFTDGKNINGLFYYNKVETGWKSLSMMTTRGSNHYSIVAVPVDANGKITTDYDWISSYGVGFVVGTTFSSSNVPGSELQKCDLYMVAYLGDFSV